jgi:hypothetical protein
MPRCSRSPQSYSQTKTRRFGGSDVNDKGPPLRSRGHDDKYYEPDDLKRQDSDKLYARDYQGDLNTYYEPDDLKRQDSDKLYARDYQGDLSTYDDNELNSFQKPKAKSRGKNLEIMLKILFDSFGIPKHLAEEHVSKKYPDLDK